MKFELTTFIELRDKVAALEAVHCHMHHEKIARERNSLRPLKDPTIDHGYQRLKYCSGAIRNRRIACAHTMARYVLLDAVAALENTDKTSKDESAALHKELKISTRSSSRWIGPRATKKSGTPVWLIRFAVVQEARKI